MIAEPGSLLSLKMSSDSHLGRELLGVLPAELAARVVGGRKQAGIIPRDVAVQFAI